MCAGPSCTVANAPCCAHDHPQAGASAVPGDAPDEFVSLSNAGELPNGMQAPTATAATAAKGPIDLPALAAPLLLQRSPAARTLYWKVLLAPPPVLHASSLLWGPEQQRLQHLHSWLSLQLHCGRPVQAASGSAYVEGPLALRIDGGAAAEVVAELATCLSCPDSSTQHCGTTALAGASGILMAVPAGRSGHRELQQRLPLPSSMAARLPTLLVASTHAAAQHWEAEIAASRLAFTGPVQVMSVQDGVAAAAAFGSSAAGQAAEPTAYSRQRLVQGLRWLAAHSPPQPVLKVGCAAVGCRIAGWCCPQLASSPAHTRLVTCRLPLWKRWPATPWLPPWRRCGGRRRTRRAACLRRSCCAAPCSKHWFWWSRLLSEFCRAGEGRRDCSSALALTCMSLGVGCRC